MDELTPNDLMHISLLAKIKAIEAAMMLILQDRPDFDELKKSAQIIIEGSQIAGLNSTMSDDELKIAHNAKTETLNAIFHRLG